VIGLSLPWTGEVMENILRLTVRSTHFFLIDGPKGKLLVDAGWDWAEFAAQLKAYQVAVTDIRYILFTHHHPDHAGLVQQIKELSGARLLIHACQIPFLSELEAYAAKKGGIKPIQVGKNDLVSPNREDLARIGFKGEIVETPGHSDDSISLVLDSGVAMIGDLALPGFVGEEQLGLICASWTRLLEKGVTRFYHSHTDPIPAVQSRQAIADYCSDA
jgi:glyoxylase-like metal-dependent hydrolase (beta-lactamase superfamily II)